MLKKLLIRGTVAIVVLAGLGIVFVRSVRNVRATPYSVTKGQLARWTLTIEPAADASGHLLSLRAEPMLVSGLFTQIFARAGESMRSPSVAAIPLVLNSEVDRASAGQLSPAAMLQMARAAGLEQTRPEPVCLVQRRISEPNDTRQAYFVLFKLPAFDVFRREMADRLGPSAGFEAAAQSPVLLIAATDASFERWFPIHADATTDCTAPIAVE